MEKSLIYEDIRYDRLVDTLNFLEQYNYVNANHIRLFNIKRRDEHQAQMEDVQEALIDYKLGIMDPSREAAGIEKQAHIKKKVGKKLRYMQVSKGNF